MTNDVTADIIIFYWPISLFLLICFAGALISLLSTGSKQEKEEK